MCGKANAHVLHAAVAAHPHLGHLLESLASADDARRCKLLLLLLHVCGGSSQHVGQATQQALEDSARLLAQWLGD